MIHCKLYPCVKRESVKAPSEDEADAMCVECGFNHAEAARRKRLLDADGLTTDTWGYKRLVITSRKWEV